MIKKNYLKIFIGIVMIALLGMGLYLKNWLRQFDAPKQTSTSLQFHIAKEATLDGVINNLYYYGFVKDKSALKYALSHTKDLTTGKEGSIMIGKNTINTLADYGISQNMTAWELADTLLNKGEFNNCINGCPGMFYPALLPGGDLAPSASEIYGWVKTFEDCVQAKGQLSSEQYSARTGEPRKCVSPDGREFIQGIDGWRKAVGG